MIRLLHLADLHLGWRPRSAAGPAAAQMAARRDAVLDVATEFALDSANCISGVVIAGDLFDEHSPPAPLVERVIVSLGRLIGRGLFVLTAPGNHDELTYVDSVYRKYQGRWPGHLVTTPVPAHITTVTAGGYPIHLYGLTYIGGVTQAAVPLTSFPRTNAPGLHVAVLHGTVGGRAGLPAGWLRDDRSLPLDAASLAEAGYDYVALGHIHRPGPPAGWPDGWMACRYAGAIAGRGFDDPGCGFLTVVELGRSPGGETTVNIEEVTVKVTPYCQVTVDLAIAADKHQDLVSAVRAAASSIPAPAFVRICLVGPALSVPDVDSLAAAAQCDSDLHVEVVDQSLLLSQEALTAWAAEPTVRGFFARNLLGLQAENQEPQELLELAWRYGSAALEGRRST